MYRKNSIIILVIGVLIVTVIFYKLPDANKNILTFISLISNLLSIYGLILAYYQILSLKDVSIKTQQAVAVSSQQLKKVLSVSELSKSKKLIEEIQQFLHNDNLRGALIRMTDLKETLIQTKYNNDLKQFTLLKSYKMIISNTAIDINSINTSLIRGNENIDKLLIINNLEVTKGTLMEFENVLKYKDHDI